ncbi:glycoside hydrolase family 3 C-terminal domain-containing protein [Microbacteriaceae bacterium VKM Ac-2855]|nr:glycoside hydrolase family 3 C-terminal domain-containing protein [Microbacteriaceae bacterium VKM Ac-2855]
MHADTPAAEERLSALAASLTLEEKVQLLTSRDFWTSWPIEKIGLRRILVSDGPSGVRGEFWDERDPSLNLPSGTALSSSWDPAVARRYGNASAVEARRKGVDVVLGPTINLHRSPLGGRHFEAFSEDPVLTAELAAAYVEGVQENGVGATPKHYIANDFETQRFTVNVEVGERALRELYLLAFEKSVVEAGAWLVMSAYNSINGVTATENDLLETPLNSEWGFDGVVISDWTAVRSLASASASQDLVFPGPAGPWGEALVDAVREGAVAESAIDRKIERILRLAARIGAIDGIEGVSAEPTHVEDGVAFAREASAAGSVLLKNEGELPWAPAPARVAVIGQNAKQARSQGGGSATVVPEKVVSPLEGLVAALPSTDFSYALGAVVQEGVSELPLSQIAHPVTGEPGVRAQFISADGAVVLDEHRKATQLVWLGNAPTQESERLEVTFRFTPEETGTALLGASTLGHVEVYLDGVLIVDETIVDDGEELGAGLLAPPSASAPVEFVAGETREVRVVRSIESDGSALAGAVLITIGIEPDAARGDALIEEAVENAKAADAVVLVVGTNSKVESEGFDRGDLSLPGRQDELVAAVVAANPRTVVIVNAGSPVLLPWRDDVSAILLGYFGGQEFGNALADIITGQVEPGGRLPTTWAAEESDVPVLDVTPVDGVVRYDEGIHIGYKAWLKAGTTPAYAFGHGLGYTTWEFSGLTLTETFDSSGEVAVEVNVANTGERAGKQVVQVYLSRAESAIDRPALWLAGFAPLALEAGESRSVTLTVPARAFANWDAGWQYEPGTFTVQVGTASDALLLSGEVELVATHAQI